MNMPQLLQLYEAVLDAVSHQATLYGLMVKFLDDAEAIDRAHAGVERNHKLLLATRRMLDARAAERGYGGMVPPASPSRFTEDCP